MPDDSCAKDAPVDGESRGLVVGALLEFGAHLAREGTVQIGAAFTPDREADALVKSDPNAFLLAVLFTQGIPAERAWAGPMELKRRLGHLDMARLASEPDAVVDAVAARPALHRFRNTMAKWISAAAARIVSEYGGDASAIWADGASAAEVMKRLEAFAGVGRKKAAMAVELLVKQFDAELTDLHEGEVAYDVQVRRVFLRSGLTDADTPRQVRAAACELCPQRPGLLDLPAWTVGRQWCRPRDPLCEECPLGKVCPRLTWLLVEGVGTRRTPPSGG